jgi:hypothetical protein
MEDRGQRSAAYVPTTACQGGQRSENDEARMTNDEGMTKHLNPLSDKKDSIRDSRIAGNLRNVFTRRKKAIRTHQHVVEERLR